MNLQLKKLLSQPFLHFLVLGGFIFGIYYTINPAITDKDTIVINDEQVHRMIMIFEKEWNRKPTDEEFKGIIERHIQQEVYYRKALRMNLDQNDELIRRRLEQKLRFVTNDLATARDPGDEELKSYYSKHKEKYLLPNTFSFSHLYFSPDKRKQARKDAENILPTLPNSISNWNEIAVKGDEFPFSNQVNQLTQKEIENSLGEEFASNLVKLPLKKWSGPILSGFGTHLVFVTQKTQGGEADFASIKEDVLRDYQYDLQQEYNDKLLNEFKKDFVIKSEIKDPELNKKINNLL